MRGRKRVHPPLEAPVVGAVGVVGVGDGDGLLAALSDQSACVGAPGITFAVPMIFWGSGGRIWLRWVAWKAAMRVDCCTAGLNAAMAVGRTKADMRRWEAAGAWRRTEGGMREAIAAGVRCRGEQCRCAGVQGAFG